MFIAEREALRAISPKVIKHAQTSILRAFVFFLVVTIETAYSILVNLFSGTFSGTYFSGVLSSEPKASNFAMFSILAASTILIYGFIAL